jgi:hypothetical protein
MLRKLLFGTTLFACFALQVHAQSTFGDLRGTTRDPSGLPLAATAVTAHSLDENTDRKVMSGDDGSFVIGNLKPGRYQLMAATGRRRDDSTGPSLPALSSASFGVLIAFWSTICAVIVT